MSKELQKIGKNKLKKTNKLNLLNINTSALTASLNDLAIPRLFYQLVIFVIDGSNSMHGKTKNGISKAIEIDNSVKLIIERLKNSKNHSSFDICFIPFSEEFNTDFGIKNLKEIDENKSFNPFDYITKPKGTYLKEAMSYIGNVTENYINSNIDKNAQVLIQLISDGAIDDFSQTKQIIDRLKNNTKITFACQFIESEIDENAEYFSWDESTGKIDKNKKWSIEDVKKSRVRVSNKFKTFASTEYLFITSPNPEEIRKHMIKSISTVSKID